MAEVREQVPGYDESADICDYLDVILRRKWLVMTLVLAVFLATLVVNLNMEPVYRATGRLELSREGPKVTKFENMDIVASHLQNREYIQTQVKLLQSNSLAQRVIERVGLTDHPLFTPDATEAKNHSPAVWIGAIKDAVKGWINTLRSSSEGSAGVEVDNELMRKQKAMGKWLLENLEVLPERDTTLISLAFSSTDPILARDAVNAMIHEFIIWQMDKRIDSAGAAKQQLERQIELTRIQLEKSESNLNEFAQKAGIVSLDSRLNLIYRQLEEVNNALAIAHAERLAKEALHKKALQLEAGSLPVLVENPLIQDLRQTSAGLTSEYEELRVVFRDDYPTVKNLKAKISDLKKRISAEEERIRSSIHNDYDVAMEKEKSLTRDAEEKKQAALELNNRAVQFNILHREAETNKQIYDSLLERAKEIDANVGTDLGNIRVVDYAELPMDPYKPNIRLNLLLAVIVGIMAGVGLTFVLEYLDNTLKRIDELSDRFQIPILGVVPEVIDTEEQDNLDHLVRLKPRSGFAEGIRTTKVSIQLSAYMDQPPKTLLITSTSPGEGKSSISANLAQAFASAEERVVIIDTDLRKPRLHGIFCNNGTKSGNRKGLSQLLSGICKAEDVIRKTDIPNLYFIAAGPIPPNPVEVLSSSRMGHFLTFLGRHFDRIILDSPPAAGFADVLVLSNWVDAVILVSTLGSTHREALRILRKSLNNVGGHLMGSIVNRLSIHKSYSGYYRYYHQYYHHHYSIENLEAPVSLGSKEKEGFEG